MSLVNVNQINQGQLIALIQQVGSGAAWSGNMVSWLNASGWMGNTVVGVTGAQDITGLKTFRDSPRVPYFGNTGTAPSARWVSDQVISSSGGLNALISQTNANLVATGASLYTLLVNASGALTGQGGGGGGSGSNVSVTGSSVIDAPNFVGVDAISITYDGTDVIVSGSSLGGGGGSPNSVTTTGFYIMAGTYVFSGSPLVPAPSQPSGAASLSWVSGVSGILQAAIGSAAPVTNVFNLSGITGNFVNTSFWFDEYSLTTGINLTESLVGRSFFFTGYALGTITTGTQGSFSGSFYQRTPTNVKTSFVSFGMPAGQFFSGRGGFGLEISGMNRIGLDIYSIGTGLTGVSIGLFGVGY